MMLSWRQERQKAVRTMFSTTVVLLQLLWLSLGSASHFYGSVVTFTAKTDSTGNYGVEIRTKSTYRGCYYNYGTCYTGNCGQNTKMEMGQIDYGMNSLNHSGRWCETETVITKTLTSNRPFQTREHSCCWVLQNSGYTPYWSILTSVDLGRRSDTNKPNNSPSAAILPILRVPQNCRRSYKLLTFDRDGDKVRCRYGTTMNTECYECKRHHGFQIDQAACTLQYLAGSSQGVYGFELVVEDLPRNTVDLFYSDGFRAFKYAMSGRRKRAVTTPGWHYTTTENSTFGRLIMPARTAEPTTTTTTRPPPTTFALYTFNATPSMNTTAAPTITTRFVPITATTTTTTTTTPITTASTATTPSKPASLLTMKATTNIGRQTTTNAVTTSPIIMFGLPSPIFTSTTIDHVYPQSTLFENPFIFSQLPLQFTFQVDPPAPSCAEGEFLPKFVSPTPFNGEMLSAEAGREVEIKVKAEAKFSELSNIIMSGPLNVTKHKTTGDEFAIRWTPLDENLGDYFPICFAVEFTNRSAIYQTELRCVILNVTTGLDRVNTVVTCQESSMVVEVEKATLPRLHYEHLRLSDPSNTVCSLQTHSNNTHIVAIVPLNACGTQIEEDADDLLFKNEITTEDNSSALITRRHQVEIKFFCQYSKRGNVTFSFSAHRDNVTVWDKGFGQFTYGFEFYPDQRFTSRIAPRMYPLEFDVGDRIFMEIEATTPVNNTELFVESCTAAPYDNSNYPHPYTLIENGCNLDSTLIIYSTPNKNEFRFSIEAFKFIGLHDMVYISCSVVMCEAGNSRTRCSRGCQPNGTRRAKREAVIESRTHYVSQGPLRLRRAAQTGNTGLNSNLVFIAVCALAAVGMICGVLLYRARKTSSFKYQRLSSVEN